jgi:hypothetical protein
MASAIKRRRVRRAPHRRPGAQIRISQQRAAMSGDTSERFEVEPSMHPIALILHHFRRVLDLDRRIASPFNGTRTSTVAEMQATTELMHTEVHRLIDSINRGYPSAYTE